MTCKMTRTAAFFAAIISTPALSATINLEFVGTADLAPSLPNPLVVDLGDKGSNTDFVQIRERLTYQLGQFEGQVNQTLEADFESQMSISTAGTANVSLNMTNLKAEISSYAGVDYLATGFFRWNEIPGVPGLYDTIPGGSTSATLLNIDRRTTADGSFDEDGYSDTPFRTFGTNGFVADFPLTTPKAPPLFFARYRTAGDFNLNSALTLSGMTGSLIATNRETGTVRSTDFVLDDGLLDLELDLAEAGTWDLELENLGLINQIRSSLVLENRASLGFGFEVPLSGIVGESCGNPATNSDNGSFCIFDVGNTWPSTFTFYEDAISSADFSQTFATTQFGSIAVQADIAPVPLPAGFPLYLAALGGFALIWRQRNL